MIRPASTALGLLALVLLPMMLSCAPVQVRAEEEGPIRWEYKLVPVSELVGEAAVNPDEWWLRNQMDPPRTLEQMKEQAPQHMQELANKMQAFAERMEQANAALLHGLNDLGAEGWEVVWMEKGQAVLLKRRVEYVDLTTTDGAKLPPSAIIGAP